MQRINQKIFLVIGFTCLVFVWSTILSVKKNGYSTIKEANLQASFSLENGQSSFQNISVCCIDCPGEIDISRLTTGSEEEILRKYTYLVEPATAKKYSLVLAKKQGSKNKYAVVLTKSPFNLLDASSWRAKSFCFNDCDEISFQLSLGERVYLILFEMAGGSNAWVPEQVAVSSAPSFVVNCRSNPGEIDTYLSGKDAELGIDIR